MKTNGTGEALIEDAIVRLSRRCNVCAYCGTLIDGSFIGAGYGNGEQFAHEHCYFEANAYYERNAGE